MKLFNKFKKTIKMKPMFDEYILISKPVKALKWNGTNQKEISLLLQGQCKFFEDLVLICREHSTTVVTLNEWIAVVDNEYSYSYTDQYFTQYYKKLEST